jgi:hypothetical protein
MKSFLTRFSPDVKGVLSGFDRVRFRGTIRWLASLRGMLTWLSISNILLKDFTEYAKGITDQVRSHSRLVAERADRPLIYLSSSSLRKEDFARDIAATDKITSGLVCVLTAVEPCMFPCIQRNRAEKKLELVYKKGKCLHHYFYVIDPFWGWLNVRLQTWFPFNLHVVTNGRERLSVQLQKKGIGFDKRGNCFVDIDDVAMAQKLMNFQLRTRWSQSLERITGGVHDHRNLFGEQQLNYYWSADETEWATDVMFKQPERLASLYPRMVRQAIQNFDAANVLRFLGRRGSVASQRTAEIQSHLGKRVEGLRIKHAINRNSIKMYDKQGSVLRVETTINNTREMKVFRASERDPNGPKSNQRLRKGVADLHRRAKLSQTSNERYLDAVATIETDVTLAQATTRISQRTTWKGRSARALNLLSLEDTRLIKTINRGEYKITGFRNRDLREHLYGPTNDPAEQKRLAGKVTRQIRLLRAHGLIKKIPKTHRYQLTESGNPIINAILNAQNANIKNLGKTAA